MFIGVSVFFFSFTFFFILVSVTGFEDIYYVFDSCMCVCKYFSSKGESKLQLFFTFKNYIIYIQIVKCSPKRFKLKGILLQEECIRMLTNSAFCDKNAFVLHDSPSVLREMKHEETILFLPSSFITKTSIMQTGCYSPCTHPNGQDRWCA